MSGLSSNKTGNILLDSVPPCNQGDATWCGKKYFQTPVYEPTPEFDCKRTLFTGDNNNPVHPTVTNTPRFVHHPQVAPVSNWVMPSLPTNIVKFNGYSHEDASKFLSDITAAMTYQGVMTNYSQERDAKLVAAFSLYLAGPAHIWFQSLSDCKTILAIIMFQL